MKKKNYYWVGIGISILVFESHSHTARTHNQEQEREIAASFPQKYVEWALANPKKIVHVGCLVGFFYTQHLIREAFWDYSDSCLLGKDLTPLQKSDCQLIRDHFWFCPPIKSLFSWNAAWRAFLYTYGALKAWPRLRTLRQRPQRRYHRA